MFVQRAELPRLLPAVHRDLFEAMVQDAYDLVIPPHPDTSAQVFRRRRVIRSLDLNVSIATDSAFPFLIEWESLSRQRTQRGTFDRLEQLSDVFLRRAMNSRVRGVLL